jgi:2-hydroxy-3-keto-5-methylthiopentenyl-1-phosphate phosphatase
MKWTKDLEVFKNKVIAVDFDGTIVSDSFPKIGEPNLELISWLNSCKDNGCKLILWTCRSNNIVLEGKDEGVLAEAVSFCRTVGLEFDAVNENLKEVQEKWCNDTRKVLADFYLDDKNILI